MAFDAENGLINQSISEEYYFALQRSAGVVLLFKEGRSKQRPHQLRYDAVLLPAQDLGVSHRRIHGPQTYVRRPWLIVSVNIGYSFNVHA